ncbi:MAG TPA: anti-sigma regulatory factor [Candidatus Binataceae bacterium]|nr:anti-sigma regulatory factor [Candidatus Binataceae bacterium]
MPIVTSQDVVLARQTVRKLAQETGFGIVDQTKLVTAISELARNAISYGGGGELQWERVSDNGKKGLRLTVADRGPGIADLELAMKDGWTSGSGLGMGLPGAKRLVNDFHITTEVGEGTTVVVTKWK